MAVSPIPPGHQAVTPFLIVDAASEMVAFLREAFGAEELRRTQAPDGRVVYTKVRIGDSLLELSDAHGDYVPTSAAFHLYVPDADATHAAAVRAGASSIMDPTDQFYGDRESGVLDPFGNHWFIATRKEDLSPEELERREREFLESQD